MTTATMEATETAVAKAEARLRRAISAGSEKKIATAQTALDEARDRSATAERHGRERTLVAQDIARQRVRDETEAKKARADQAERDLRASGVAPRLALTYAGVEVVVFPEVVRDVVARNSAVEAFTRALRVCQRDFEAAVGARRAGASGATGAARPLAPERLVAELRDVARVALRHGTMTIEEM
jgi:hypothetical protein